MKGLVNSAVLLGVSLTVGGPAAAISFGTYEPRGQAMGSTTVALGSPQQAQFYNPALLAFHNKREENSHAGRFYFPIAAAELSSAASEAAQIASDNLDERIASAVDAFNAAPNAETAASVRAEVSDLEDAIDELAEEDLVVESFAGLAIAEPSLRAGGGFHIGVRVLGGGNADITNDDRQLLADYLEAMDFVASAGSQGAPHPELFDGASLRDPSDDITSTASVRGAAIIEWGVSAAKEFEIFGQPVALGVTPKLMEVRVYEEVARVVDGEFDAPDEDNARLTGNVDLGAAVEFDSGLRFGLAIKDLVPQSFTSDENNELELKPRARLGTAWVRKHYAVGLDVDLQENDPVGFELPVQEVTLGGEVSMLSWLALRAGYKHDLSGNRDDTFSGGLGIRAYRFLVDLSYLRGADSEGASLQLGWAF